MNSNYVNRLVGHRGLMATHPENSLTGFKAAIEAGARFIECDLQLTKDKQPVVFHDATLVRTTGIDGTIFDLTLAQAQATSVHYPERFGERYAPEPMASLPQFLVFLAQYPDVKAMIEFKQQSIDQFSLAEFVEVVCQQAGEFASQVIIISFNADVVAAAQKAGFSTGWVIDTMDEASQGLANVLLPQYLITDVRKVDVESPQLWAAPQGYRWCWMLYDVMEPQVAKDLLDKGVDLIETGNIKIIQRF
ncbi:MAG: glycerophosphoryl diester phosphodiesterase [Phenylobacterium sp.]|jgi:glycerophosphoryl diester phosphodiesterase